MSQLLWNERGQVGCALPGHAPFPGTDTWVYERWGPLAEEIAKRDGLRCESCAADERRESKKRTRGRSAKSRAEYSRLRALVDLRLDDLLVALERHERSHRNDSELLVEVEAELTKLAARLHGDG